MVPAKTDIFAKFISIKDILSSSSWQGLLGSEKKIRGTTHFSEIIMFQFLEKKCYTLLCILAPAF